MAELFRDLQCSMDVAQMVELGKFDKEFTVYGCAYRYGEETYYRVSEYAETIYRFCEKSRLENICPTNVMQYYYITGVPAGTKEDIWQEVKWNLGYQLMEAYPDDALDLLNKLTIQPAQNGAWPMLKLWQKKLDGLFLRDWLRFFDSMVAYCAAAKQLDYIHYRQLKQWSDNNWMQMEDDIIIKDIHERTLHGFGYQKDGTIQYKINAQYIHVYQDWQRLLSQGAVVTPIYSKTYWFKMQPQFSELKKQYQLQLEKFTEPCLIFMEQLHKMPPFIEKDRFFSIMQKIQDVYKEPVIETMKFYGKLWNCL